MLSERPSTKFALPLLALTLCHGDLAAQNGDQVAAIHRETLKALAIVLPRDHSSRHPLDDEIARRWFDLFIRRLDPHRLYFTAADIRGFGEYRRNLDDHARRGDLSFAILVRRKYTQRLRETTDTVMKLLEDKHDFTKDEQYKIAPDGFAENREARNDRWRRRIKFEILDQRSSGLSLEDAVAKLHARYLRVALQKQLDKDEELYELYLDAFARSFGPHSRYYGERTLVNFRL